MWQKDLDPSLHKNMSPFWWTKKRGFILPPSLPYGPMSPSQKFFFWRHPLLPSVQVLICVFTIIASCSKFENHERWPQNLTLYNSSIICKCLGESCPQQQLPLSLPCSELRRPPRCGARTRSGCPRGDDWGGQSQLHPGQVHRTH